MCHGFRHVFQRGLIYGSTGDVIKSQSRVHVVYIIEKVKKFQIIFFWYSQTVFFESDRRWHEREEEKKFLTDFKLKKKGISLSLFYFYILLYLLFSHSFQHSRFFLLRVSSVCQQKFREIRFRYSTIFIWIFPLKLQYSRH